MGGPDLSLQEINAAAEVIYENVDPEANIIFGALVDESNTTGEVSITVSAVQDGSVPILCHIYVCLSV